MISGAILTSVGVISTVDGLIVMDNAMAGKLTPSLVAQLTNETIGKAYDVGAFAISGAKAITGSVSDLIDAANSFIGVARNE